jgi:hypothetical protein
MRKIAASEAQVGDVVAEPVVNDKGRTLLPKGARLSAAVVSRLAGWGVAELFVEGEGEAPEFDILVEGAEASAESSSLLAGLEERFAEWESDATMMRIKAIARRHLGG